MKQSIGYIALIVQDYDQAIDFYVGTLGFRLIEDTHVEAQNKRWVLVAPPGANESQLLLARAAGEEQATRIGNQTDGRVFLFLHTDNFWRDYNAYRDKGALRYFHRDEFVHLASCHEAPPRRSVTFSRFPARHRRGPVQS
jgi:catechol 2,3-dioxygenase-like lactoylglutathione lyase family enzyme